MSLIFNFLSILSLLLLANCVSLWLTELESDDNKTFTKLVVAILLSLLPTVGVTDLGSPINNGDMIDLLNKVSVLIFVTILPLVGNSIIEGPEVLKIRLPVPFISKSPPKIIFLPALLIPVPPCDPGKIPEIEVAESATTDL